ncbi:MAG: phosphoenolpyruvate--protein phosphotransferase [Candidatus Lindowbacteria bacterium]|nr:phosphoenolpyruvate--protein phosphotransferase [Candidatus Lindowbacteria bacterium]
MERYNAYIIAPGIAIAPIHTLASPEIKPSARSIDKVEIPREYARFINAVVATKRELKLLKNRTAEEIGEKEAAIFDAHLMLLDDPLLHLQVSKKLETELVNVEAILARVIDELSESFASLPDPVMSERSADITDVGVRLVGHLQGKATEELVVNEPCVLSAREISPSTAALLDTDKILGLIVETGSPTSHTAILAHALGIPAVVLKSEDREEWQTGTMVVVDGLLGEVIVDPDAETKIEYDAKAAYLINLELKLRDRTTLYAQTTDDLYVNVLCNLEIPSEIAVARENGAHGVGLYRTEYLFMNRRQLPDEEEQYRHYRVVVEAFTDLPVTIRTMDIGGDKFFSESSISGEMNPFLGLRAIRYSFAYPELFRQQIRAILRASQHGTVKIMFPMIACLEEVEKIKVFLAECSEQVGVSMDNVEAGIMIETPGAALAADSLASEVEFFSIGSNDLIQYTMAAVRGNESLNYLHNPVRPVVLNLMHSVVDAANEAGIDTTICGEMASDIRVVPLLVGAGFSKFSMNPRSIPAVKEMIRRISRKECEDLFNEIVQMRFVDDVSKAVEERFGSRMEDLGVAGQRR